MAGLDADTPIETLTTLVHEVSKIVQVPNIDKMDMGMTVEVENDHYVTEEVLPIPYRDDSDTERNDREECIKKEIELVDGIERWRKLDFCQHQAEELRTTMRGRAGPSDLRNRDRDLRDTMRRQSLGPTDLRLTHWNWDQDLRVQMRPRPRSGPPDLRSLRNQKSEKLINERFSELITGEKDRDKVIERLQAGVAGQKKVTEEEYDSNVLTDSYDTNEEGEVEPSEDELTNVQYSETDNHEKAPLPGPSRVPATPIKSNQTETKAKKKKISPIKYPEATPKKNSEDLPLSKLITPRRPRSDARQDLRKRLDMVPIFYGTETAQRQGSNGNPCWPRPGGSMATGLRTKRRQCP